MIKHAKDYTKDIKKRLQEKHPDQWDKITDRELEKLIVYNINTLTRIIKKKADLKARGFFGFYTKKS